MKTRRAESPKSLAQGNALRSETDPIYSSLKGRKPVQRLRLPFQGLNWRVCLFRRALVAERPMSVD